LSDKGYVCSSSSVDLSLSSLDKTRLLSLHSARVVFQQSQVFEDRACVNIKALKSASNSGNTSLSLARESTSLHIDIHIKQARVLSHCQRQQDAVPLRRNVEVLKHWLVVDGNLATASLDIDHGDRSLTFSTTPSAANLIKFSFSLLLGQVTTEVEQVDAVKLDPVVGVDFVRAVNCGESVFREGVRELGQVSSQVMLVEGVLLHRVEQSDFLFLLSSEIVEGVISLSVSVLDLLHNLFQFISLRGVQVIKAVLIVQESWCDILKFFQEGLLPIQVSLGDISSSHGRLFKHVPRGVIVISHVGFAVKHVFVE